MKFKVTVNKIFEVDTDLDWDGDLKPLLDALRYDGVQDTAGLTEIGEAIMGMLAEEGLEAVVGEAKFDENNYTVEIEPGTALDIPKDESEEDED